MGLLSQFKKRPTHHIGRRSFGMNMLRGENLSSHLRRRPPDLPEESRSLLRPMALSTVVRSRSIKPGLVKISEPRRDRVRINRLPLLGLRFLRGEFGHVGREVFNDFRKSFGSDDLLSRQDIRGSVCHRRGVRRRILFVKRIAGFDKRRSKGKGGSYRRTEESLGSCGG